MKVIFLSLILVLVSFQAARGADRAVVDQVLAVVNHDVITQSEFDAIFRPVYEKIKESIGEAATESQLREIRLKLLNQMIEDKLVYQESIKLGIEVSDVEVEEEFGAFKKQFQDEETFEKELKLSGVSVSDLKQQFRERTAITRLHQHVIRGKVVVSPEEVAKYYAEHSGDFVQKDQVELWCITVRKNQEAIQKGLMDETAKEKVEGILAKLKKGADFDKLAKAHSDDASGAQGGSLGWMGRGDMIGGIDSVIFSLPEGALSDVLETERGYHIFKVGKRTVGVTKTFDDVRDQIRDVLFRQKAHLRFLAWMEDLKKQSYVSIR
ncbi:MAG: hypothetical protein A3A73_05175 [Omnitrophica bacterium RIFCSPLOWO2_01_FULL_50_24]|nr:MAG: hypothetical protein A3A73_05175 [Omnitrophica bacterium RIFCSPLOWO2_01_FULL_50_24]